MKCVKQLVKTSILIFVFSSLLGFSQKNDFTSAADKVIAEGLTQFAKPQQGVAFITSPNLDVTWVEDATNIIKVPRFEFTDQSGHSITDKPMKGNKSVVAFIFTSCGKVCPATVHNLKTLQKKVADDDVQFYLFSVNPDFDRPRQLSEYAKKMKVDKFKNWHFITGEKEKIYELARNTFFADAQEKKTKEATSFLHTENVYLVDGNKKIRAVINGNNPNDIDIMSSYISQL